MKLKELKGKKAARAFELLELDESFGMTFDEVVDDRLIASDIIDFIEYGAVSYASDGEMTIFLNKEETDCL